MGSKNIVRSNLRPRYRLARGLASEAGLPLLLGLFWTIQLSGCQPRQAPVAACADVDSAKCQPGGEPVSSRTDSQVADEPSPQEGPEPDRHAPPPPEQEKATGGAMKSWVCGKSHCTEFETVESATGSLVADKVSVVGFGEAHTPAGFTGRSTVRRFTEDILPVLAPRTGYLIVELLVPPSGCEEEQAAVQQESDAVTEGQSENNQSQYVALGHRARALGVVPDILRPSCEQMRAISQAEVPVAVMMETIAELSARDVRRQLPRQSTTRPLLLLYGGALHNDVSPREGLESWSYGARLDEELSGRYLEVDLILPELIGESESWRKFPWYEAATSLADGHGPVLIRTGESSVALVLPREGRPTEAPPGTAAPKR